MRIIFMLCLAVLSGLGFEAAKNYLSRFMANRVLLRSLLLGVILAVFLDLMVVNSPVWRDAFISLPLKVAKSGRFYQLEECPVKDNENPLYIAFLQNVGVVLYDHETIEVPRYVASIGSPDYKSEAYLRGVKGVVNISEWSPNRVAVDVEPQGTGYLVLNQNYYPGWRAKGSRALKVEPVGGLVAVKVAPDEKKVVFFYLPVSFIAGSAVSLVTLLSTILFLCRQGTIMGKERYAGRSLIH